MVIRQDLDSTSALLTVQIGRDEFKSKVDSELKRFRQRAAIKGFRPGQAPMDYVKRLYGKSIKAEALNEQVSRELYDYLRDSQLDVLGQPLPTQEGEGTLLEPSDNGEFYKATFEIGFVAPFEVRGLDHSVVFERLTISNIDDLAEEDLEYARKRLGKRTNPEGDIQENDMLKIEAVELDGDAPKAGGFETTVTVLVQDVRDADFKQELLGLKKGDTLRFNARAIEPDREEAGYRKYILGLDDDDERLVGDWFQGVIGEVSRLEPADLDETFFHRFYGEEVNSREDALEEIKGNIRRFYEARANSLLMRDFQKRLMELNTIELPEAFLKRWLEYSNRDTLTPESIEQEFPAFVADLRWTLLRDKIRDEFGLEVTLEEVREDYRRRVRQYFQGRVPAHLIESTVDRLMQKKEDVEETQKNLESDRIFEAILNQVQVTDKPISSAEFHQLLESLKVPS